MGNDPENVSNMQTKEQQITLGKKGLKIYADMIICATDSARLVPTICHHKLPTTAMTSLTLSNF